MALNPTTKTKQSSNEMLPLPTELITLQTNQTSQQRETWNADYSMAIFPTMSLSNRHGYLILFKKIFIILNPFFDSIFGQRFFSKIHFMYLHSVIASRCGGFHCYCLCLPSFCKFQLGYCHRRDSQEAFLAHRCGRKLLGTTWIFASLKRSM